MDKIVTSSHLSFHRKETRIHANHVTVQKTNSPLSRKERYFPFEDADILEYFLQFLSDT